MKKSPQLTTKDLLTRFALVFALIVSSQSVIMSPAQAAEDIPAPPGVPTSLSATPDNLQARVTWTAPATGGTPTSYTAISTPGSFTCTATAPATSCSVTGLTNGTPYTFTVTSTNGAGTSTASEATNTVTPGNYCLDGQVCSVGDIGPGGGLVYFVTNTPFACGPTRAQLCQGLEIAPRNWSGNTPSPALPWALPAFQDSLVSIENTDFGSNFPNGTNLGWGLVGTLAIKQQHENVTTGYAAGVANAYNGGGKTDWSLPSREEATRIGMPTVLSEVINSASDYALSGSDPDVTYDCAGTYASDCLWTSWQGASNAAVNLRLSDNNAGGYKGKGDLFVVRPVRAILSPTISSPTIRGISPSSGPASGGTTITITGSGFVSGATVTVGDALCANVEFNSAISITCTTPGRSTGAKDVVVTNPDTGTVTRTGGFTFTSDGGGGGGDPETSITSCSFDGQQNLSLTLRRNQSVPLDVQAEGGNATFAIYIENGEPVGGALIPVSLLEGESGSIGWVPEAAGLTVQYLFYAFDDTEGGPQPVGDEGDYLCSLTITFGSASTGRVIPLPAQTSSITSCPVASGPTTGGNTYSIAGSFTSPIVDISMNGKALPTSAWVQSATAVTITMPAHAQGTVSIQIYNGQSPILSACNYTYVTPVVTSTEAGTATTEQPLASTLKLKVFFGLGSSAITAAEKVKLESLAVKIAGLGNKITITVTGYAQPTPGSEKTDGALSKARAAAVASFLKDAGVDTTVIYAGAGRATANVASSRYVEIVADNK